MASEAGKGSGRRPTDVSQEVVASNWERIFGKVEVKKYQGPTPRPICDCAGWGCFGCCNTEEEIRSRQGTYG